MSAPEIKRSGNLITVLLLDPANSGSTPEQLAETALGRGEQLEVTYSSGVVFGFRAVRR